MDFDFRSFLLAAPLVTPIAAPAAAAGAEPLAWRLDPAWDDFLLPQHAIEAPVYERRVAAPARVLMPVQDFDFGGALLDFAGYDRPTEAAVEAAADVIRARAAEIERTEDWARRIAEEAIAAAARASQPRWS